jgi:triosephosphate isomerase (TIM)
MRPMLIAGNWKMNLDNESATALAKALAAEFGEENASVGVLVCPPFPYLSAVGSAVSGSAVQLGAQNVYFEEPGAFTGEVASEMLLDVGCKWVIIGHSERRHVLGETDEVINKKVKVALSKGLDVILCVGELLSERNAKQTEAVLERQMKLGLADIDAEDFKRIVIAYEPVWAIGTGVTATPEQAEGAHAYLRKWLENRYNAETAGQTTIQYGGSVKPDNAKELLGQPNVDGALVGGAALKPELFVPIVKAGLEIAGQ